MDSAEETSHNGLNAEALTTSTSQGAQGNRTQADSTTSARTYTLEILFIPLSPPAQRRFRDIRRVIDSKAFTTVVYPDQFQIPLSSLQATRDFQLANTNSCIDSTAQIAANSPRYRRRSSTFIDGVHDLPDERASLMAPAQLYSTMSGRLFHSGRIAIVLVGPPARGKT